MFECLKSLIVLHYKPASITKHLSNTWAVDLSFTVLLTNIQTLKLFKRSNQKLPLPPQLAVYKQAGNALVFVSVSYCYGKKVCYRNYLYLARFPLHWYGIAYHQFFQYTVFNIIVSIPA